MQSLKYIKYFTTALYFTQKFKFTRLILKLPRYMYTYQFIESKGCDIHS